MNKDGHELTKAEQLFIDTHNPMALAGELNKALLDRFDYFDEFIMDEITSYITEWAQGRS